MRPAPPCHAGLSSEAFLRICFRLVQAALPSAGSPHTRPQVQKGLQALQDERERVFQAWERKQERLQAMHREQLFLRKCGRLDQILTAQEAGPPHQTTHVLALPLLPVSPLQTHCLASWGSGFFPDVGRRAVHCLSTDSCKRGGGAGCLDSRWWPLTLPWADPGFPENQCPGELGGRGGAVDPQA